MAVESMAGSPWNGWPIGRGIRICALRTSGLQDTELQQAQCGTIRSKLLKIGARVRVTVRKVWIAFSESDPFADLFRTVLANLQGAPRRAGAP